MGAKFKLITFEVQKLNEAMCSLVASVDRCPCGGNNLLIARKWKHMNKAIEGKGELFEAVYDAINVQSGCRFVIGVQWSVQGTLLYAMRD